MSEYSDSGSDSDSDNYLTYVYYPISAYVITIKPNTMLKNSENYVNIFLTEGTICQIYDITNDTNVNMTFPKSNSDNIAILRVGDVIDQTINNGYCMQCYKYKIDAIYNQIIRHNIKSNFNGIAKTYYRIAKDWDRVLYFPDEIIEYKNGIRRGDYIKYKNGRWCENNYPVIIGSYVNGKKCGSYTYKNGKYNIEIKFDEGNVNYIWTIRKTDLIKNIEDIKLEYALHIYDMRYITTKAILSEYNVKLDNLHQYKHNKTNNIILKKNIDYTNGTIHVKKYRNK